jgi:hypothetical protein
MAAGRIDRDGAAPQGRGAGAWCRAQVHVPRRATRWVAP